MRKIVGTERECIARDFEVSLYGRRFFGNTRSHIDWHVYYFGEYDPLGIALLRHIASNTEDCVYMDIGTNTGTHMLAMSNDCSRLHCFEPYPKILKSLERHVNSNRLDHVSVHKFGMSTQDAEAMYYENVEGNFGAGSFEVSHQHTDKEKPIALPLRKGDDALKEIGLDKIDLVKIDVEGHEKDVLTGIGEHLERYRPFVFWEFGPTTLDKFANRQAVLDVFPEKYELYYLGYSNRWTRSTPVLREFHFPKTGNLLAVPLEKQELLQGLVKP